MDELSSGSLGDMFASISASWSFLARWLQVLPEVRQDLFLPCAEAKRALIVPKGAEQSRVRLLSASDSILFPETRLNLYKRVP